MPILLILLVSSLWAQDSLSLKDTVQAIAPDSVTVEQPDTVIFLEIPPPHEGIGNHQLHLVREQRKHDEVFYIPIRQYGTSNFLAGSILPAPGYRTRNQTLLDLHSLINKADGQISAGDFSYTRNKLNLEGRSALFSTHDFSWRPDTPIVHFQWEKYSFGGNYLQLEFKRRLGDSVGIGLDTELRSTDSSGTWTYQNASHQPYLGGFSRDSTQIPMTGRNLKESQQVFSPWVAIYTPLGQLKYTSRFFWDKNEDAHPDSFAVQEDPSLPIKFQSSPFQQNHSSKGHGIEWRKKWNNLKTKIFWNYEQRQFSYKNLNQNHYFKTKTKDTLSSYKIREGEHWLSLEADYQDFYIQSQTQRRDIYQNYDPLGSAELYQEQRQIHLLGYKYDSLLDIHSAWNHIQSPTETLSFPSFSGTLSYPFAFTNTEISLYQGQYYAPLQDRYFLQEGRYYLPNAKLNSQKDYMAFFKETLQWKQLSVEGGWRREKSQNWIAPAALPYLENPNIPFEKAYSLQNYTEAQSSTIHYGISGQLGNWNASIKRFDVLDNRYFYNQRWNDVKHLSQRYYKGHIQWTRTVLQSRKLGLSTRVDWQWHGPRTSWLYNREAENPTQDPNFLTQVQPFQQSNFLVLDFEARLRVLEFEMFYRIQNMNHSIYQTEAGYTPHGVNFRWGVEWTFKN